MRLSELLGCRVETTSGQLIGEVVRVDLGAGTPLLGAVVLPRLNAMRADEENLPVVTLPAERRPEPRPAQRPEQQSEQRNEQRNEQRTEERREPRPDETAVLDAERTQPMRRVPASPAPGGPVRPRPSELDDVTAVIDLGSAGTKTKTAEKAGEPMVRSWRSRYS